MKRDMDLVREILLAIESDGVPSNDSDPMTIGEAQLKAASSQGIDLTSLGRSGEEIVYHLELLAEAELIIAVITKTRGGVDAYPVRMTWAGHDFLDQARQPTRWESAMKIIKEKAGTVGFDVLKALLLKLALERLGLEK
jgi:hypothetical protein